MNILLKERTMKYIIFLLCFILVSCTSQSQIDEAKKEILQTQEAQEVQETTQNNSVDSTEDDLQVSDRNEKQWNSVTVSSKTEVQFIEIDDLSEQTLDDGEVIIEWKTLGEVDKIEVSFSNEGSNFPNDQYTLKTFSSWDNRFKYVASSRFQVLDFGTNIYLIKAYSWKEISETEVTIQIQEKKDTTISYEEKIIGTEWDSVSLNLPKSELFWNPISLGASSFTYSGIEWFEIIKQDVSDISCENITDTLSNSINSWFYWNTCRDIIKEKGISFYVLKLTENDSYIYQKHYVDYIHGFYGIYDIESWEGVTKENIQDKNNEYKDKNETIANISTVDDLMKAIVLQ